MYSDSKMSISLRSQLSLGELRCCPHTTYYSNLFVLRTAVTINGQAAEIGLSEKRQLTINCRYSSTNYLSLNLYSACVLSEWEVVLNKYGASHVSNFWCADVPSFQVSFSSEKSLRDFLHSHQKMEIDMASILEDSALTAVEDSTCLVEAELFLVAPNLEKKNALVTRVTDDNCSRCLEAWKKSEVFEVGALFKSFKMTTGGATVKGELSLDALNVLMSELSDVVDWFHFGLYLGVPPSDMLRIEREREYIMDRLSHMLIWWVNNGEQPTWSGVVRALSGIRMNALARRIAMKYDVPVNPETIVNTPVDPPPIHIADKGNQTVIVQIPLNIREAYKSIEERDEELQKISESLPAAKKTKIVVSRKYIRVKQQMTKSKASNEILTAERNIAREELEGEEGELRFLKQLRQIEKKNDSLQSIIAAKERRISQLREKLAAKETELCQARGKIERLRELFQQTTVELSEKSTQVREMERAKADMERERSQANLVIMQLCAMNQGTHSLLERVPSTEIHSLRQAVEEKEEEVRRLSSQLEAKEIEKEKLLAQMESQSQQAADELIEVIEELSELRSHLMEAEDGRMRAEVELEDLKSRRSVVNPQPVRGEYQQPDPQNCIAVGRGLQFGETNQKAQFHVHLLDANGVPCVEKQEVRAELKSQVDGSITKATVAHQTGVAGSYEVSYQPSTRGRHKLSVSVNGTAIDGSPFGVYVQQPPQLMGQPVRLIRGLKRPRRVILSSSGQLIVTESGKIAVFGSQLQSVLEHEIDSLEEEDTAMKLDPRGVVIDDNNTMYVCDYNTYKLFKVSSTGKVLKSVSGRGSDLGKFDYPDGIALQNNKLFVCDVYNHRIQIFSCDLSFIGSFGGYGSGEGEFSEPRGIALDQEGNIYVAESGNHRIQVFLPSGTFLRTFGKRDTVRSSILRGPMGIHIDHNIVYVADRDNHSIFVFTTLGEFIGKLGEFNKPRGITMDRDGFLYVCDWGNSRIQVL